MARNIEWLNQNAGRAYPFQEDMMRMPHDASGNVLSALALPNYVIVDMIFTIPSTTSLRMYLAQLAYTGNILTFVFKETVSHTTVVTVTVDKLTHTPNQAYSLTGVGDWYDARGWLVVGDLRHLVTAIPESLYSYSETQTLLEVRVVRPALRGIRSLRTTNAGNTSAALYGHIKLLAGANIRLEYDEALNGIWVHAEPNAGYQETCDCLAQSQQNLVRTINGIPLQDVTLVGDGECVTVTTAGDKITISDKCSEPCCGCPELEFLNESVKILEVSIAHLEEYAEKLAERITTFVTNFVMTVSH